MTIDNTLKYPKFILPILLPFIISPLTPFKPHALNHQPSYIFPIFLPTIIPSITQPITIPAVSIIPFTIILLLPIIHTKSPLQRFPNTTISLIPIPFFISTPFLKTPLPPPIPLQFLNL
ncbi:anion permease, partial [Staphylococcus capitis]|uniref:anion permease n=1 Tax=Staphylococcus capitis TaxID=29388 RepID=UPI0037095BB0